MEGEAGKKNSTFNTLMITILIIKDNAMTLSAGSDVSPTPLFRKGIVMSLRQLCSPRLSLSLLSATLLLAGTFRACRRRGAA